MGEIETEGDDMTQGSDGIGLVFDDVLKIYTSFVIAAALVSYPKPTKVSGKTPINFNGLWIKSLARCYCSVSPTCYKLSFQRLRCLHAFQTQYASHLTG